MFRLIGCLAVVLVLASVGEATAIPTGPVIAETGFNDASGIHGDGAPNSPYELGSALVGQPTNEPGWIGPWTRTSAHFGTTVAQSLATFEGDGAGAFSAISNTARRWASPQTGQFVVESQMRFGADSLTAVYIFGEQYQEFDQSFIGTQWSARADGTINVSDGAGDGSGSTEFTGFRYVPNQWHKFTQIIDYENKTWRFFMDDVEYVGSDELGFRGTPPPLDGINILSNVSNGVGVYVDDLRISAIPEPSSLILLASGAFGLLLRLRRRRK